MASRIEFGRAGWRLGVVALALALGSVVVAHAAGLTLSSGGVVLKTRNHGAPETCTLTAVADTFVRASQAGTSFGTQTTLEISNSATATERLLVEFDLDGCTPAISSDAIVHSATVRLTMSALTTTTSRTYRLHRATSAWTESTTWSTQPSVAGSATSSVTISALTLVGTSFEWPVARDVQAFVAGDNTNLGWRLADSAENGGLVPSTIEFNAREAGSGRPQLVITYAP